MKSAVELRGTRLVARVMLHNYRYPRSGHQSGDYAIAIFDVLKIIEGEIPVECMNAGDIFTQNESYQITVVGNMPKIMGQHDYIMQGTLVIDKDHGPQYEVETLRLDYDLSRPYDQRKFFSFFLTENQIDGLFEKFENPIKLLEEKNIGELKKIKGVGPVTAVRMCQRYDECKDNGRAYVALKGLDLTKHAIDRLIKHYGSADIVVEKIETNPYVLIKEVKGYGWKKADAIALKQGFTRDCKPRVIAYTQYYLEAQSDSNGNSWVSIEDLLMNVAAECAPVTKDDLTTWIKEIMCSNDSFNSFYEKYKEQKNLPYPAMLFYDAKTRRVGLFSLRILEKEIATHFERLEKSAKAINFSRKKCEEIIKSVEKEQGFEYTDEQLKAIWTILDNNVSILSGQAGTGKTSVLRAVTAIFKHYKQKVEQCALSGRASSLLSEVTKVSGKTIHRLLAYMPDYEKFAFNERNPLHADVVILDEASMVDGDLFLSLISAIKNGAKFIMVGDFHQLESIGSCNILKDCLTSGYIKSAILNKIHRQAARSGIIAQSFKVSSGESIAKTDFAGEEIRGELQDFKLVTSYDARLVQANIIKEFKKLYFDQKIPLDQIQIIVPMKTRGDISCRVLNGIIQSLVNGETSFKEVYVPYEDNGMKWEVCFKPNDRIIVTKNNYHAMNMNGQETAIFNGNIGWIKDIGEDNMIISLLEQGDVVLPKDDWYNIQLAYAITVHKKQGDSVPYAIIGLDTSCYALYSKELLYTAITRASKYCIFVTQPKSVNQAAKISRVKQKQTWLKEDLFDLYMTRVESEGA